MTDVIVPSIDEITRSTELPADERYQAQAEGLAAELRSLAEHPGWAHVEAKLQGWYDKYRNPIFPAELPFDEVGKQYRISQTIAALLKEVLDDVRPGRG